MSYVESLALEGRAVQDKKKSGSGRPSVFEQSSWKWVLFSKFFKGSCSTCRMFKMNLKQIQKDIRIINKYKSFAQYLPPQMLRVCSLAGEPLATFSAEEVQDKRVHQLKSSLAKQTGATRFRQRWLAEDHTELHDNAVVPCCDVQLVVLHFVQAEEEELEQLLSACGENKLDELVDLLRKPLNPDDIPNRWTFATSLHLAAENGYSHIVQFLLEAGTHVDVCIEDPDFADFAEFTEFCGPRTALHVAAENGRSEVAKLLLEAGANKDAAHLHVAAKNGHSEVAKLLLEAGADKDAAHDGQTPLHVAAQNGHSEVVKLLFEAGAIKDVADFQQRTTLHLAAKNGHFEVVKLLLDAGADKDATDYDGLTALSWATYGGHFEVVNLLLEAGADKGAADRRYGKTALHWAAQKDHSKVVKLLLEAGADKEVTDYERKSPLDLAIRFRHQEVVDLLQQQKRRKLSH